MATDFIQGMKEESAQSKVKPQESVEEKIISRKNYTGVSVEDLVLKYQSASWSSTQVTFFKKMNNTSDTPRQLKDEASGAKQFFSAVDITYAQNFLYVLGEDKHKQKNIFCRDLFANNSEFTSMQSLPVTRFFYTNPYFLLQHNMKNQLILTLDPLHKTSLFDYSLIQHNTQVLSVGIIDQGIFSGSVWPSITLI
jgi:hypothetical protein